MSVGQTRQIMSVEKDYNLIILSGKKKVENKNSSIRQMPRMSLISSDATTAPAEKGNGYNPDRLGLVINLVISSN